MLVLSAAMNFRWFWFITLFSLCHPQVHAQVVTTQLPPAQAAAEALPNDPALTSSLPEAHVVPQTPRGTPVTMRWDHLTVRSLPDGNEYLLDGHVVRYYGQYILHADHATYNDATGEIEAHGHLMVDGGPDDEHIVASHGSVNIYQNTADFFDVTGSLGVRRVKHNQVVFTSLNPYLITGKEVRQLGKGHYLVLQGTMTACRLPRPDWRFYARRIELNHGKAQAANASFHLFGIPLLYVPYVKHEIGANRTSGILLPVAGNNSTYGAVVGESVYLTLGRSADLVAGTLYYSNRGPAPFATFRYRGRGDNYAQVRFHSLLDYHTEAGNNLGGIDFFADGRYDFTPYTRAVIDAEYLSSYLYRLTFEQNYAAAINSEVQSQLYLEHERAGFSQAIHFNRYENFESVSPEGNEVRILHLPQVDLDAEDHQLPGLPVEYSFHVSSGALSRYDYNPFGTAFRTGAEIPRVDIWPALNLPMHFDGWNFRPEFAVRDTWYDKSQRPATLTQFPRLVGAPINRLDVEAGFTLRPPVVGRDFDQRWVQHLFGGELRHTLSPMLQYRYVSGIDNFNRILRFDDTEVASNTNELEYGLTQHLYRRTQKPRPCTGAALLHPQKNCGTHTVDWLTWRVAQKYYFDSTFGNAVTPGTPNPLLATLDFTGVDFLEAPRHYSPVISRFKWTAQSGDSAEWDIDYDTKAGRLLSSNVYTNFEHGNYHLRLGDAYLNTVTGAPPGTGLRALVQASKPTAYNQLNITGIYGSQSRLGFNTGASTGYDLERNGLQYGAVQATYNWNCCGFSFELRRFSLANHLRNDTEELFSFTLAGFGSTGIPHSARVF